ncbi:MAG TPA: hypothetical protein VJN62_02770 [Gemmatimonadales bacterium]|nr:hypothetical protein [Gemmatimonadales bacterium]
MSVTVATVQKLILSSTTTALGVPTINNLDSAANPVSTVGPTVTGEANVPFSVTVSSATANFTSPPGVTKPAADLSWALSANGTYLPLTTGGTNIIHQTSTGASSGVTMFYHTAWYSSNAPGSYSINIVYTLTEP